jgi:hypothetical protein
MLVMEESGLSVTQVISRIIEGTLPTLFHRPGPVPDQVKRSADLAATALMELAPVADQSIRPIVEQMAIELLHI